MSKTRRGRATNVPALVIGSLVLLGCQDTIRNEPTASAISANATATPGSSATGSGQIISGAAPRRITFTAVRHADGDVSGEYLLNTPGVEIPGFFTRIHAHIICSRIVGNQARIGGVVDQSSDPGFLGRDMAFLAEDNGEGASDPPDRLSPPFIPTGIENFAATFCEEPPQLTDPPLLRIENGNVQIR